MGALWEEDHAYYCNEGNYFANGQQSRDTGLGAHFKTWASFIEEWGNSDPDYNLLFRWDWRESEGYGSPFNGDTNYRNGQLACHWMGQRKGLYNWTTVEVCRADEPDVRAWLETRWAKMLALWAPIATPPVDMGEK